MEDPTNYIAELGAWLRLLPEWSYWLLGGLLVAAVALVGVWLYHSHRRQQSELELERRAEESAQLLRRDVYLPAAEAMARAQDFLAKFPGKDWTREEGSVVVDYVNGALGKVNVVGSERAIRTTMALATEFSISYLSLVTRRRPIIDLQDEVEHLDSKIAHFSYERDQLLSQLTRSAADGIGEAAIWNDLNLRFDKVQRQIAGLLDARRGKLAERNRLRHELALEAARCSLKLGKLAVPAYLALREELELPIDDEEYRALAHASLGELEHALQRLGTRNVSEAGGADQQRPPAGAERADSPRQQRNLRMVRQSQQGA